MGVALRTVLVTKTGRVYRTRGSSVTTCMADVTFVVIPNKQASNKKKEKKSGRDLSKRVGGDVTWHLRHVSAGLRRQHLLSFELRRSILRRFL